MNAKKNFIEDTGGAILVVGVFMTLFLIGGLFFLLGIGDALVYHDHMQEAADVSAFTGAVVHARFMNMIAAINLIMLALVAIHLMLAMAHLVTWVASAAACLEPACIDFIYPPLLEICEGLAGAEKVVQTALKVYDAGMKVALWGLSGLQMILARTAFIAGPAASLYTTALYHSGPSGGTVIGISEGLSIPGLGSGKLGLPVYEETPDFLCEKLGKELGAMVAPSGSGKGFKKAMGWLGGIVGKTWKIMFCSSDFDWLPAWDTTCYIPDLGVGLALADGSWWSNDTNKGPKHMWDYGGNTPVGNGSDWNSVYGIAEADRVESSEKSVAVGGRDFGESNVNGNQVYFAESEFYFDCTDKWDTANCESDKATDNAMYSLGWRARLVRFHLPRVVAPAVVNVLNKVINLVNYH